MNKEIEFNRATAQMRMEHVLIGNYSKLGRELMYSFKVAMGIHINPSQTNITKINPLVSGSREMVVK